MNDSVIATFVLPLTSEERENEMAAASPAKTAGKETPASVSTAAPFLSKVEITISFRPITFIDGPIIEGGKFPNWG